jgi:PIN domain nuclease of toxin-antitoxin system
MSVQPLLLDTHLVLWAALHPERLPARAGRLLLDRGAEVAYSVATLWEVAIKSALGRQDFNVDAAALRSWLLAENFVELDIRAPHVLHAGALPPHHRDPFDRMLIAQAAIEGLTLLTVDKTLARYGKGVRAL